MPHKAHPLKKKRNVALKSMNSVLLQATLSTPFEKRRQHFARKSTNSMLLQATQSTPFEKEGEMLLVKA
jgi:hypothetical protein